LAAALLLASCSSPSDKVNDACSLVKDVTSSVPGIKEQDGANEIVPRIDQQLDAARKAQSAFQEANADAELQAKWNNMIGALQENRDMWEASRNPRRARGTDMVIALGLAAKKERADTAKTELKVAAEKSGLAACGDPIKWQY
jgi:hypothetical protein